MLWKLQQSLFIVNDEYLWSGAYPGNSGCAVGIHDGCDSNLSLGSDQWCRPLHHCAAHALFIYLFIF